MHAVADMMPGRSDAPGPTVTPGQAVARDRSRDDGAPAPVGEVWLVGAGPGDPGLLTVRGRDLLASADVVVADRLATAVLLDMARPEAEIIHVGKGPTARSRSQEEVNDLLVERARAGLRVVRLKGGDPYLLGRGGEEAEACAVAGVPCRVVPGVTAAIAAPAYAGIPVTHRGLAQEVTVVSGHLPPGHPESTVDWAALAASRATIVVLMGVARLVDIADALLEGGRAPDTPATVVERATTPAQRVLRSTLDSLVLDAIAFGLRSPAVVVIGEVAARVDAPVDPAMPTARGGTGQGTPTGPLRGIRVLVPRTRPRPGLLAARLRRLGADTVEAVVSERVPVADPRPFRDALPGADTLVLADPDEVGAVVTLLRRSGADIRVLAGLTLVAASPPAAAALESLGLTCVRAPAGVHAADTVVTRPPVPARVVVCGAAPAPVGIQTLRRVALLTDSATAPDARIAEELRHGDFDVVAFASSTAARCVAELYGPLPDGVAVAAMGRKTAQACEAAGLRVDVVATEPGIHPLADAVAALVADRRHASGR